LIDPTFFGEYSEHMKVSAQYASTHFDELTSAVDQGELVEIERPQKAALRLVLVPQPTGSQSTGPHPLGPRILGAGKAELRVPSEEEWAAMDRELEQEMIHAPLMTTGEI
jgi:hypothetical protein